MSPQLQIVIGDALLKLRELPAESVQCCVTSPPYWGLRDYSADGQLGLEKTPEEYVAKMVEIFREVRRVLRKDGTLWLNLGDSYASGWSCSRRNEIGNGSAPLKSRVNRLSKQATNLSSEMDASPNRQPIPGLKEKDLCGIPWRVAFALQRPHLKCKGCNEVHHQDQWGRFPNGRLICPACELSKGNEISEQGWYLRQDIIWSKPNPMPESVTDRCTKSHEYIFLLTKSSRYFYDAEAIREKAYWDPTTTKFPDGWDTGEGSHGTIHRNGREKGRKNDATGYGGDGSKIRDHVGNSLNNADGNRNKRSVWTVATAPYPEAHFATYPPDLVKPCILAGTSARGCCARCGAPWERIVEKGEVPESRLQRSGGYSDKENSTAWTTPQRAGERSSKTLGWQPTCKCELDTVPCTVLDPFAGSGTTGQVALELCRSAILIELNPKYAPLIEQRCTTTLGLPL